MAVPRNRLSNSRKNIRRSHHAKKARNIMECPNCKKAILSHRVCGSCAFYNGKTTEKEQSKNS